MKFDLHLRPKNSNTSKQRKSVKPKTQAARRPA